MIQLTRLNNHPLVVNSDLIKFVEQAPDTVITLVNGDKIVVRETAQDVLERVVQFRRSVLQGIMLCSDNNGSALPPPFLEMTLAMKLEMTLETTLERSLQMASAMAVRLARNRSARG